MGHDEEHACVDSLTDNECDSQGLQLRASKVHFPCEKRLDDNLRVKGSKPPHREVDLIKLQVYPRFSGAPHEPENMTDDSQLLLKSTENVYILQCPMLVMIASHPTNTSHNGSTTSRGDLP